MEFSFESGGNRLVGDLVLPPGPGPHPFVVFVEGSGPGGRDQGSWAARLAAAGFGSLAYDKPGSGASSGDWTAQDLDDRAAETVAAVTAVQERVAQDRVAQDRVARDRPVPERGGAAVALIGGSQGGWVAHLAAASTDRVAAVVTVSGPGVGVLEQERYRLRHQLPAAGFGDRDVAAAVALTEEQISRVRAGVDPGRVHADQRAWHSAPWFPLLAGTTPGAIAFLARISAYDPVGALSRLRCPLLAVFGADDVQVPVAESTRVIDEVLTRSGHADHEIVVFPGADHQLRVAGPPAARVPGFDELVIGWLRHRVRSAPGH